MPRQILHRESRSVYSDIRARQIALEAEYPGAEVKVRRAPRYGGWNLTVSIAAASTRTQTRGTCQCCGGDVAVDPETHRVSLHGYKRPGYGYTIGRCPGARYVALQRSNERTMQWHAEAADDVAIGEQRAPKLQRAYASAVRVLDDESVERGAYAALPRPLRSNASVEETAAYEEARAAWAVRFPKHDALLKARREQENNDAFTRSARQERDHFAALLAANITGTPYRSKEV